MKTLLYISPLPQDSQTGGANAVNYHIYKQLEKHFNCTYVQINPKESKLGKWRSQFLRKILRRPGRFNFYSKKRLRQIAKQFDAIQGNFDMVFFRGFTPWIACQPRVPYFAYNDVHFLQFFKNTFSYHQFIKQDIERICLEEKKWLIKAEKLFFESQWGANQCHDDYAIKVVKLKSIGRGGNIPIPKKDTYSGSLNLVVIANNFYQKGGDLVFEAFKLLKQNHKTLQLHIIGGHPGQNVEETKGVVYHGFLYKESHEDLLKLESILAQAFLLMHVTREDTNPLVISEAGYFGCPSISVNHFAIPDLIRNYKTGVLLEYLPTPQHIAEVVSTLISDKTTYQAMRSATWLYNHRTFSWDTIGNFLNQHILPKQQNTRNLN